MADRSEQSEQNQLFIKVVDAINYVTSVSNVKLTSSRMQKCLLKNTIGIQDGLDKNYNIFQTTRFNHTMIFFKLTD